MLLVIKLVLKTARNAKEGLKSVFPERKHRTRHLFDIMDIVACRITAHYYYPCWPEYSKIRKKYTAILNIPYYILRNACM